MYAHEGWIFSEDNPPQAHVGGLFPKYGRGLTKPWAYIIDLDSWYEFIDYASTWQKYDLNHVPKEYRAALLLLI